MPAPVSYQHSSMWSATHTFSTASARLLNTSGTAAVAATNFTACRRLWLPCAEACRCLKNLQCSCSCCAHRHCQLPYPLEPGVGPVNADTVVTYGHDVPASRTLVHVLIVCVRLLLPRITAMLDDELAAEELIQLCVGPAWDNAV